MSDPDHITLPRGGSFPLTISLAGDGGHADRVHLLTEPEAGAISAAIAAGRPLLVRGEPGTGKSQLARAAASALERAFVQHVIDSHSESRDLLWSFDAVRRLADAQLAGTVGRVAERRFGRRRLDPLRADNYLSPGPLWWVFDWPGAEAQSCKAGSAPPPQRDGGDWRNGCVLLLDEIDKAESELPNGLLEALGNREFTPFGRDRPVRATSKPPLMVITSNEERALPDAFVRRCLVLRLAMPDRDELIARGRAHFPEAAAEVLEKAADLLMADRDAARRAQIRPWPGQAEYFDMLRAALALERTAKRQLALLDGVARYTLKKYAGLDQRV
jgi:MoxR-like ATPase